ncbi:MAG: hypothetical protein U0572_10315 [Phycisphaerales bacterium]
MRRSPVRPLRSKRGVARQYRTERCVACASTTSSCGLDSSLAHQRAANVLGLRNRHIEVPRHGRGHVRRLVVAADPVTADPVTADPVTADPGTEPAGDRSPRGVSATEGMQ